MTVNTSIAMSMSISITQPAPSSFPQCKSHARQEATKKHIGSDTR